MKQKRSLGQNFFINKNLGEYIVDQIKEVGVDSMVEIGPGTGFFTEMLIPKFKNVIVVEKDASLANNLAIRFPSIEVINEDFLDFNLNLLISSDFTFFGSLPYNVSKAIVRKIIQSKQFTNKSFFILQKEVAEKYIYKPPYSTLSLTTALYADCKKVLDISRHSFRPKPNVTSSLIWFSPTPVSTENHSEIENLIHLAFRQPRKNIRNNLKGTKFQNGAESYAKLRPAQLSLEDYKNILRSSSQ